MKKTDYHLHAEYSVDSRVKACDLIEKAIALNYSEIAFTEHLDLLPWEMAQCGIPALVAYRKHISTLQAEYPELSILCGIEVGDYHQVRELAEQVLSFVKLDLILGSVHFLSDRTNVAIPLPHPLSFAQRKDYFEQNLELVSTCKIDVLAHLGVYKRYYSQFVDETPFLPLITEIFKQMIAREIALEINYSPLRKTYPSYIPEPELVSLYKKLGGKRFTIGSDSHHISHFDDHYDQLPLCIQDGRGL